MGPAKRRCMMAGVRYVQMAPLESSPAGALLGELKTLTAAWMPTDAEAHVHASPQVSVVRFR
jgi:hypothetical protein